jgi:hypothetical protein
MKTKRTPKAPNPAPNPPDIFTEEEFAAVTEKGTKLGNTALHRGGSVDLVKIGGTPEKPVRLIAVVHFVPISEQVAAEVQTLLTTARAKAAQEPPAESAAPVKKLT